MDKVSKYIHRLLHAWEWGVLVCTTLVGPKGGTGGRWVGRWSFYIHRGRVTAKGTGPQGSTGPQGRSQCGLDSIHRRSSETCL